MLHPMLGLSHLWGWLCNPTSLMRQPAVRTQTTVVHREGENFLLARLMYT